MFGRGVSTFFDPAGYNFVETAVHEPRGGTPFFVAPVSSYNTNWFLVQDIKSQCFIILIPILVLGLSSLHGLPLTCPTEGGEREGAYFGRYR